MADRFIWYELMTTDQDAALDFYKAVVGWSAADHQNSSGGMRYTILSAGERGVGGVMELTQQMCDGGARAGWVGYIDVGDTDSKASEIAEAGGKVLMGPDDIPNVGRFAMVADPGGAAFYLLTPLPRDDDPGLPEPSAPGTVGWHELYSSLGDKAAFDFYSGRFGWETYQEMPMGEMGTYRIFGLEGAAMGGMMNKPESMPRSVWGFYLNVDGIDAATERVKVNGGQVLMGPHQVPDGSWVIHGVDPQGANFALVSKQR